MPLSFEQKLQNLADLAVKVGVGLQPGQRLIVSAPLESAPLARLITGSAYKAGARLVDVMWKDDAVTLARFKYAPRDSFEEFSEWRTNALQAHAGQGHAFISVSAAAPDLLKDEDAELVATAMRTYNTHMTPFRKVIMADGANWCIVSQPIPGWAAKVFPDASSEGQMLKLWDLIFKVSRADQPDAVAAWQQHLAQLAEWRDYLNSKRYVTLKYTAPGTDFTVGLPQNHIWKGGRGKSQSGISFVPNLPTEEVFTMPHRDRADGVVSSSKPLSYAGVLIENFSLTFEKGRVVRASAERGEDILRKLVETDEGSARLGEVALIPHSSPVSQSGVLFYNTLFDENAANHLALGRAYQFTLKNGVSMSEKEFEAAGGNTSLVHVDFMIGSNQMDVDGITANGTAEPVMRAGEWAF